MNPKTKTFIVTLTFLLILATPAWAGKVSKDTSATIRETIKEQLKHPGFYNLKDNTCCADIIFTISSDGKMLVKRIISNSEDLSDYVRKALSDIQFYKLQSPMNQYYRIKLSFRLI
ncbi:MAG: hypothetical protein WCI48_01480 [Bacteroidota bacterium]